MKLIALTIIVFTLVSCGKSPTSSKNSKSSSNINSTVYCNQEFINDGLEFVEECGDGTAYNTCEKVVACLEVVSKLRDNLPTEPCETVSQEDLDETKVELDRLHDAIHQLDYKYCSETSN